MISLKNTLKYERLHLEFIKDLAIKDSAIKDSAIKDSASKDSAIKDSATVKFSFLFVVVVFEELTYRIPGIFMFAEPRKKLICLQTLPKLFRSIYHFLKHRRSLT